LSSSKLKKFIYSFYLITIHLAIKSIQGNQDKVKIHFGGKDPLQIDERFPVTCCGEPLVEGSKGDPPPWSQGGVLCPAREREAGRPGLPGARWKGETRSGFPLQIDCQRLLSDACAKTRELSTNVDASWLRRHIQPFNTSIPAWHISGNESFSGQEK
jgi:hypothetical protein